MVKSCSL